MDIDSPSPESATNSLPEEKRIGISNTQLQMMDKRIDSLEATIGGLQEKIQNLNNLKNERDTIIIELFKMLENGIKSRFKLLSMKSQINDGKNPKQQKNKKDSQGISIVKK